MPEIKWAYDENTGTFSALPASSFLLPALGLLCLAPLIERALDKINENPRPLPNGFNYDLFCRYQQRYKELAKKRAIQGELTDQEYIEWHQLMRPPWAEPGELWTYG